MPDMGPARATIVAGFAALTLLSVTAAGARVANGTATSRPEPNIAHHCNVGEVGGPKAGNEAKRRLAPEIVGKLIAWVNAKTGWRAHAAPVICFVPDARLSKMLAARNGRGKAVHIGALYSRRDDTIYLPTEWGSDDLRDRATLLHELIHHLQAINKVEVSCPNVYEFQAYSLTIDWLREQGVEQPMKMLHINDVALFMLSQCPVY